MSRQSYFKFESYRVGLTASTLCNLLSQGLGFVVLLLFARYFGAGHKTDVFLFATTTFSIAAAFITSLNASIIIPEFMRLLAQESRQKAVGFANGWLLLCGALAVILGGVTCLFPFEVLNAVSRFPAETAAGSRSLIMLLSPLLLGEVLTICLADVFAAQKFFTVPLLSTVLNRLVQVVFLVSFHQVLDIQSLALGALTAYVLQIGTLLWMLKKHAGWTFRGPVFPPAARVWRNAGAALAGNVLSSLASLAPIYFLSGLGAGAVSALNYALRVVNIPQTFLAAHVSSITGIKLNEQHARGEQQNVDDTFQRATRALIFILAPLAAFLFLESRNVVGLLFERGSFDARAASEAALFLKYLALTLPFLGVNSIVARLVMAAQKIAPAVAYQLFQGVVQIAAVYAGVRLAGARGYLLAVVVFHIWNLAALIPLMRILFPGIRYRAALAHLGLMGALGALVAGLAFALRGLLPEPAGVPGLGVSAAIFAACFMALNARFHLNPDLAALVAFRRGLPASKATKG